jgi:L-ascorbate metabolism protein UlaG (beta-lactamase superfamily)
MNLADLRRRPAAGEVGIWWLGQSGFVIRHGDDCLVIDPYLSDTLTKKYAATATPHVRMHPRVVSPEDLAAVPVTAALCTHHHTDHLDPGTLAPLVTALKLHGRRLTVVAPEAWRDLAAERAGVEPTEITGIDEGQTIRVGSFEVSAIAAAHEPVEYDAHGRRKCLGYVLRSSALVIYHSGDTLVYDGLAERLRSDAVDVVLLPINGKIGNMSGTDAARLAKNAGARLAIPCHYDMFEFNTADPADDFIPECEKLVQPYRVLALGESIGWTLREP